MDSVQHILHALLDFLVALASLVVNFIIALLQLILHFIQSMAGAAH